MYEHSKYSASWAFTPLNSKLEFSKLSSKFNFFDKYYLIKNLITVNQSKSVFKTIVKV